MPRMEVTLTKDEIEQAVREWAEKHHGMKPKEVNVSARLQWVGNGVEEMQSPVPEVSFTA